MVFPRAGNAFVLPLASPLVSPRSASLNEPNTKMVPGWTGRHQNTEKTKIPSLRRIILIKTCIGSVYKSQPLMLIRIFWDSPGGSVFPAWPSPPAQEHHKSFNSGWKCLKPPFKLSLLCPFQRRIVSNSTISPALFLLHIGS